MFTWLDVVSQFWADLQASGILWMDNAVTNIARSIIFLFPIIIIANIIISSPNFVFSWFYKALASTWSLFTTMLSNPKKWYQDIMESTFAEAVRLHLSGKGWDVFYKPTLERNVAVRKQQRATRDELDALKTDVLVSNLSDDEFRDLYNKHW